MTDAPVVVIANSVASNQAQLSYFTPNLPNVAVDVGMCSPQFTVSALIQADAGSYVANAAINFHVANLSGTETTGGTGQSATFTASFANLLPGNQRSYVGAASYSFRASSGLITSTTLFTVVRPPLNAFCGRGFPVVVSQIPGNVFTHQGCLACGIREPNVDDAPFRQAVDDLMILGAIAPQTSRLQLDERVSKTEFLSSLEHVLVGGTRRLMLRATSTQPASHDNRISIREAVGVVVRLIDVPGASLEEQAATMMHAGYFGAHHEGFKSDALLNRREMVSLLWHVATRERRLSVVDSH